MNNEYKRRHIRKDYYKDHPCRDTFVCKVCGNSVAPDGAGGVHRNHCPNCLSSVHLDNKPGEM